MEMGFRVFNPKFEEMVWAKRRAEKVKRIAARKRDEMIAARKKQAALIIQNQKQLSARDEEIVRNIMEVIDETASEFGIDAFAILRKNREANTARARMIAVYRVKKKYPEYSYPKIGAVFGGRDHTTIMHAHKKMMREFGE